jgi:hypothetical protein
VSFSEVHSDPCVVQYITVPVPEVSVFMLVLTSVISQTRYFGEATQPRVVTWNGTWNRHFKLLYWPVVAGSLTCWSLKQSMCCIYTVCCAISNSAFYPHSVLIFSVWFSQLNSYYFLYSIHRQISVTLQWCLLLGMKWVLETSATKLHKLNNVRTTLHHGEFE